MPDTKSTNSETGSISSIESRSSSESSSFSIDFTNTTPASSAATSPISPRKDAFDSLEWADAISPADEISVEKNTAEEASEIEPGSLGKLYARQLELKRYRAELTGFEERV